MTETEALEAARQAMPCTCIDAYKDRGLEDPMCAFHNYGDMVAQALLAAYRRGRVEKREFAERALQAFTDHAWRESEEGKILKGNLFEAFAKERRADAIAAAEKDDDQI